MFRTYTRYTWSVQFKYGYFSTKELKTLNPDPTTGEWRRRATGNVAAVGREEGATGSLGRKRGMRRRGRGSMLAQTPSAAFRHPTQPSSSQHQVSAHPTRAEPR